MQVIENTGIADAIAAAGSQEALAGALGVSQQAVSGWLKQGWVPHGRVVEIENTFGVPRARLVDPKLLGKRPPRTVLFQLISCCNIAASRWEAAKRI